MFQTQLFRLNQQLRPRHVQQHTHDLSTSIHGTSWGGGAGHGRGVSGAHTSSKGSVRGSPAAGSLAAGSLATGSLAPGMAPDTAACLVTAPLGSSANAATPAAVGYLPLRQVA
jgi:hypothetical protein